MKCIEIFFSTSPLPLADIQNSLSKLSGGVNKPDINALDKLLSYIKMFPRLFQTISTEEIK